MGQLRHPTKIISSSVQFWDSSRKNLIMEKGSSKLLEQKIKVSLIKVANAELSPKEAGINKLLTSLRMLDEATAEVLQKEYIDIIKGLKK